MANQQLIKGARFAAGPIVPIGSIAAAGFEKGQKRVQDIQRREFEKRKLEAENFEKRRNEINKTLLAFRNNASKIKVNAELSKGFWRQQLNLGAVMVKKNSAELENAIRSGKIEQYDALKLQDKNKEFLESLQKKSDDFVGLVGVAEAIDADLSSTVSSETIGYANGILNGDEEIINEISKKFDIEIDDMLSPDTFKKIGYVAADIGGIDALFNTTRKAAQSAAQKGAGKDGYMDSVKLGLAELKLSDEQYISAAFDFLGKEMPGYTSPFESYINQNANIKAGIESKNIDAIKDENNSGSNIDEIKEFVNKAMLKAAEDSYESFKSDYADKFDKGISADVDKPNKNLKLDAENYAEELNSALSNYDFSMFNNTKIGGKLIAGSEIRNGKLYLEYIARTTSEGQEMAELAGIDLNDKVRLKALLLEYVKGQKGLSVSNKISNIITDEMLFTIEDINKQNSILFPSPTTKPNLP